MTLNNSYQSTDDYDPDDDFGGDEGAPCLHD